MTNTLNNFSQRQLLGFFFLAALLLRLAIAQQDLPHLDRLFLPDDTYYTLSISRNIAAGIGPSIDGTTLTSGFQPLISLFHIPLFHWFESADAAAKGAVYISATIGAISTLLIGLILLRLGNHYHAALGMLIWTISPTILRNDLNGLETSLSGFFWLTCVLSFIDNHNGRSTGKAITLGALCSLAMMARIDNAFLVLSIGLAGLYLWGVRYTGIIVITAVITISPWWGYLWSEFGHIIPESGKAVKQIHQVLIEINPAEAYFPAIAALIKLGDWINLPAAPITVDGPIRLLSLIISLTVLYKVFTQQNSTQRQLTAPLFGYPALIIPAYITLVCSYWFFGRYFYSIYILLTLCFGLYFGNKLQSMENGEIHGRQKILPMAALSFILCISIANLPLYFSQPQETPNLRFQTLNGYRDIALNLYENTPEEKAMHIGAMQSGALTYYAPTHIKVTNLDGVVNQGVYEAIKANNLQGYLKQESITHFYDWPAFLSFLKQRFGSELDESCLKEEQRISQGRQKTYVLYEISHCL